MSTTMSAVPRSAQLQKLNQYFDEKMLPAEVELRGHITKFLPSVKIRDLEAAMDDLLPALKSMQLQEAEGSKGSMISDLFEIDQRMERVRILSLAIKDLVAMKETEIQVIDGKNPWVQMPRSTFRSHADVRKHYQGGIKKLKDELGEFRRYDTRDWGMALWEKWLATNRKLKNLEAERERERALGHRKGWGSGKHEYNDDADDDTLYD